MLDNSEDIINHMKFIHPFKLNYNCVNKKCNQPFTSLQSLKKHLSDLRRMCSLYDSMIPNNVIYENLTKAVLSFPTTSTLIGVDDDGRKKIHLKACKTVITKANRTEKGILSFIIKLLIISKLFSYISIPRSIVQDITDNLKNVIESITSTLTEEL